MQRVIAIWVKIMFAPISRMKPTLIRTAKRVEPLPTEAMKLKFGSEANG